jgi:hypothetical protein
MVFNLYVMEGNEPSEIAKEMDIPVGLQNRFGPGPDESCKKK